MKISHVNPRVVDDIIGKIEGNFRKMIVTRGKVHTFVWMDIEFKDNDTVSITMIEYLKEYIEVFGTYC